MNFMGGGYGGGGAGGSGGGGGGGQGGYASNNTTTLDKSNTYLSNSQMYAVRVKITDLFSASDENESLLCGLPHMSLHDERVSFFPMAYVKPSYHQANMLLIKEHKGCYLDKLMPLTACVTKRSLNREFSKLYGVDDYYKTNRECAESVGKHTNVAFADLPPHSDILQHHKGLIDSTDNDVFGDEDALLLFLPLYSTLQMLANADTYVRFTKFTECATGAVHLGASRIPVQGVFSLERIGCEELMYVVNEDSVRDAKYALDTSQAIFASYREHIRVMFKFGKGDNGKEDSENESEDQDFESRLLKTIHETVPENGEGALSIYAAAVVFMGITNTITKFEKEYSLDTTAEMIMHAWVASTLTSFAAATISRLSVKDDKGNPCLMYDTHSNNIILNLQVTACRGSKTLCGFTMFLVRKCKFLSESFIPTAQRIAMNIETKGLRCSICASKNCALHWTSAHTKNEYLAKLLTADGGGGNKKARSTDATQSPNFNGVTLTEWNNGGGFLGSASVESRGSGTKKRIFPAVLKAYEMTVAKHGDKFVVPRAGWTDKDVVKRFGKICYDVFHYVKEKKHGIDVFHRCRMTNDNIQVELTDNMGGVPKLEMGMVSLLYVNSLVLSDMARFVEANNKKLEPFEKKTRETITSITSLIHGTKMGIFKERYDQQGDLIVKKVSIAPETTDTKRDINYGSQTITIPALTGLNAKLTHKYKKFGYKLEKSSPEDDVREVGGAPANNRMTLTNATGGGGQRGTLNAEQKKKLDTHLNLMFKSKQPGFNPRSVTKEINSVRNSVLAGPFSYLRTDEITFADFTTFLKKYTVACFLFHGGYVPLLTKYSDGAEIPTFVQLTGIASEKKSKLEPVSSKFTSGGPTLLFAKFKTMTLKVSIEGKPTTYYVINMVPPYPGVSLMTGGRDLHLANQKFLGCFIPINVKGGKGDPNTTATDQLVDVIKTMASMSTGDQCELIKDNATAIIAKVQSEILYMLEEEDEASVVSFDSVAELFDQYGLPMLLDNERVAEMIKSINDPDQMAIICDRAKAEDMEREGEDENMDEDGEDEDMTAYMNELLNPSSKKTAAAADMEMDGDAEGDDEGDAEANQRLMDHRSMMNLIQ